MIVETEANLDATGKISAWLTELWSDSHSTRPSGDPGNLLTAHYLQKPFPVLPTATVAGATATPSRTTPFRN